jgi:RNA polymerase sigma-70 factor (ECF subfamily)
MTSQVAMLRGDEQSGSEPRLVQRAAAGDEGAFAALVAAYSSSMARLSFAMTGDKEMARDAVQVAWEIAWRKLPTVRDPRRVRSWLLVLTANETRRVMRRQRTRRAAERLATPIAATADPDAMAIHADLERALGRLEPAARELLGLRFGLGMSSVEIAGHTGSSPNAIRIRLTRLLARLRQDLRDG